MQFALPYGASIDLGGIAKGWSAQQVADRLAHFGSCLVDAGGDVVTRGIPQNKHGFPVGVALPGSDDVDITTLMLHNAAAATSGIDYRHWQQGTATRHHIIDPRHCLTRQNRFVECHNCASVCNRCRNLDQSGHAFG